VGVIDSTALELAPAVLLYSPNMIMDVKVSYNLKNYLFTLSVLNIYMKTFQHGVEREGKRNMNLGWVKFCKEMVCSSLGTEQKSRQYFNMDRRQICQI